MWGGWRRAAAGLDVSKLGSEYSAVLLPVGGCVFKLGGREVSGGCQLLCSWRGLPVIPDSLGHTEMNK